MMVGAGFMMAAIGAAIFFGTLLAFGTAMIGKMILFLITLTISIYAITAIAAFAVIAFTALAGAITLFAASMWLIPLERLELLSNMMQAISKLEADNISGSFQAVQTFITELDAKKGSIEPMLTNMALITTGNKRRITNRASWCNGW